MAIVFQGKSPGPSEIRVNDDRSAKSPHQLCSHIGNPAWQPAIMYEYLPTNG
jgi:hypothetical protein